MRLLIAEDDVRLLRSLSHILQRERYLVDGVDNGEDALLWAETGEYDGLVLDIMMPGMDGVTVLKRLRQKGVDTPALFLTARAEVEPLSGPRRKASAVCSSPPGRRWNSGWRAWTPGPTTTWPSPSPYRSCWPGCGPCSGGRGTSPRTCSRPGT